VCRIHVLNTASCAILMGLSPLFGQGMTLVGSGYSDPTIIRVAPGQITTFFVAGLKTVLSEPVTATSLPLPNKLAGISVTVAPETTGLSYSAPLLAVRQINSCGGAPRNATPSSDCLITAITVQMPFELPVVPNGSYGSPADVMIAENGNASKGFKVYPETDNLHVVNTCDPFPAMTPNAFCGPAVTHSDGTLVTANSPAKAGETVVIYAFGLGQTTAAIRTGDASPTPAAILSLPLRLQFDFRPNAGTSRPYVNPLIMAPIPTPAPVFAGLTPGQVGLYQINVTIPSTIPAVESCGTTCAPTKCTMYNTVQSNLTIDIGADTTFDGAPICVQPPQ
jgi:hypothetical protein